jgi:hypothetical protein
MAKWANDAVLDLMFSATYPGLRSTNLITVCTAQPATYADATTLYDGGANTNYRLADVVVDISAVLLANGDTSGRKLTVPQQADIPVDATGTATHIALCNSTNTALLYVTTCTSQSLSSGGTVTIPAFDVELADPS